MFETAELGRELEKREFNERGKQLRIDLLSAQRELAGADFPVIVLLGGVDGAGKGEVLNRLFEWLDARGLDSHAVDVPTQDERERPEYWRYWMSLPPKGRISIFLGGWYAHAIERAAFGEIDDDAFGAALSRTRAFEKNLADDGALIIKIWLHISEKVQRSRLKRLEAQRETRWRVTKEDWQRHDAYADFRRVT
jgi:polyphosphate kinase 2 (PPK2 family)